jgi:holo-[acyl-carrier protein] synthase
MIVGIGCDIIDISRFARELELGDSGFTESLFTPDEISYCRSMRRPERHFAARFAAKEAFFKAVSDGDRVVIPWHDVEIAREKNGKPVMVLHGEARWLAHKRGVTRVFVTLSHSDVYAMADVVLEA